MPDEELIEINSFGLTHIGKVREDNQDSFRLCDPHDDYTNSYGHLYGIADGMGGYAHGGIASSTALETFFDTFYSANGAAVNQKIRVGMQNANLSVYQAAQRMGASKMGTTLTAANIIGRNLFIGHIGDSRAYLIRNNEVKCLTNDHTQVGDLVRMRILTPDKIRTHSQRSVLNKSLGLNLFIQPDIFRKTIQNNDLLILCTDGVWSVIEDNEFGKFAKVTKDPERLSNLIIEMAIDRNSDDNLSIVVIELKHLSDSGYDDDKKQIFSISNLLKFFGI